MRKRFEHQLTNVYVFLKTLVNRLFHRKVANMRVLIILDGLIGDTILIQDFLKECKDFFIERNSYEVDLFFSKAFVKKFFEECCDTTGFSIIDGYFPKKEINLKDLRAVIGSFNNRKYEYILNPMPKLKGDKITGCLIADNKFTVRDDNVIKGKILNNIYRKLAYTSTAEVPKSEMEFSRYKKLLNMCGDNYYKTSMPKFINKSIMIEAPGDKYCVLSVGASEIGKRWDLDRYVHIIDFIHDRYGLMVAFVGADADTKDITYICENVKNCEKVRDYSGKTSYAEWIEIIRQSLFLIGNDSASVHIAAAVEVPSICIVGEWHYKRFYPYIIDNFSSVLQCIVNCGRELECRDCGRNTAWMCNENCKKRLVNNNSLECIDLITEQAVIDAIVYCLDPILNN